MRKHKFLLILLALFAFGQSIWAQQYITDVMVIGDKKENNINTLKTQYQNDGWTLIDYDLNKGAGGAYIYLLYKTTESQGSSGTAITDLYLRVSGSNDSQETFEYSGRTYTRATCDGSSDFVNKSHGDLNSGASGKYIHLYYTKSNGGFYSDRAVKSLSIDNKSSLAVGENGGPAACDLNKGAGGDYIYMHMLKSSTQTKIELNTEEQITDAVTLDNAHIELTDALALFNTVDICYPVNITINLKGRAIGNAWSQSTGFNIRRTFNVRGGANVTITGNGSISGGKAYVDGDEGSKAINAAPGV